MAKKMIQQRYYAAAQDMLDGKLRLTLLEEGKDTAGCQSLMKSEDFAKKFQEYVAKNMAFRVAIIREEPAVRIVTEPSPLAKELAGQIQDPVILAKIMDTLAKHGQATGGQLVFKEDTVLPTSTLQRAQEDTQEPQGSEMEIPQAPAAPVPPAPPQAKTMDPAGKVPYSWQALAQEQLLAVAKSVNPSVNDSFTRAACLAAIGKYLEAATQPHPAPQSPPPLMTPPGYQAGPTDLPPADEEDNLGPNGAGNVPPSTDVYWVQEECPGCRCLVWRHTTNETRKEPIKGYPEHRCPWYDGLKTRMASPPPPPPAPPVAAPVAPPAAVQVPPPEGMVKPQIASGQAPVFGRGFGVPPMPPKA